MNYWLLRARIKFYNHRLAVKLWWYEHEDWFKQTGCALLFWATIVAIAFLLITLSGV